MREILYLDVCCFKRPFDDALHLAFAEQSAARWFVTTDDRLLKRAMTQRERLHVEVVRPDQVPLETRGDDV